MTRSLRLRFAQLHLATILCVAIVVAAIALTLATGQGLMALLAPAGFLPFLGATGLDYENVASAPVYAVTGAPSAGELAGIAPAGTLLVDIVNFRAYCNVGTKAAPVWKVIDLQAMGLGAQSEPAALGGTNQTLTAALLLNGFINGAPTAAGTYTTDTAAAIVAAIAGARVGDTFRVRIANTAAGAFTITLAGGTGVTLRGNLAIAQTKNAVIEFLITNIGAGTQALTGDVVVSA